MADLLPFLVRFDSPEECFSSFSMAEAGYRWTLGNSAKIFFDLAGFSEEKDYVLTLESGSLDVQDVTILVNGVTVGSANFQNMLPEIKSIPISGSLLRGSGNVVEFLIPGAKRPGNDDLRVLGLCFKELRLKDADVSDRSGRAAKFPGGLPYLQRRRL